MSVGVIIVARNCYIHGVMLLKPCGECFFEHDILNN